MYRASCTAYYPEQRLQNIRISTIFYIYVHRDVHGNIIPIVKPTRCTNVSNLFYFGITLYCTDTAV